MQNSTFSLSALVDTVTNLHVNRAVRKGTLLAVWKRIEDFGSLRNGGELVTDELAIQRNSRYHSNHLFLTWREALTE